MTRSLTILGLALAVTIAAVCAAAPTAGASTLASKMRTSETQLKHAKADLDQAQAVLATAVRAHLRRGLGPLVLEVKRARHAVKFWTAVLADLRTRQRQQAAAGRRDWPSLIREAARQYGVSGDGLYRLMMMESGGRAGVVCAGRFYGLYQYALVTWRGSWNPWRSASVFDGAAQIKATAYAVKKGMGRQLWANTYGAAF